MKKVELLEIKLEEITLATNDFHDNNCIGRGGFGKVYKGALPQFKERMVAFKRLDRIHGQGNAEYLKEIAMLSDYVHENLISLLGFCNQGKEMILVYEYASRGSLDRHLNSVDLTWKQRLKICIAAAKGLNYLHDPRETSQRLIHCDIKSANILLDDEWNAKVADFGLSKIAPVNQHNSTLITNPSGTPGYCDPLYMETYKLTKESDVYSFGVVLFEVLCGRPCCVYSSNGQLKKVFVSEWINSYKERKLDEIIFKDLGQPMDPKSLEIFSGIAFECLKRTREERPTMSLVVEKLEMALKCLQLKPPKEYEEKVNAAVPPLAYESLEELKVLLSQGFLVDDGKTWTSINANGQCYEMISIEECLTPQAFVPQYSSRHNSRFAGGSYEPGDENEFKTRVKAQHLSPETTYTVNLVFKKKDPEERYIGLEYESEGGRKCYSFLSDEREDGWMTAELYQFTSNERGAAVDLDILFKIKHCDIIAVEGIEFRPIEKVRDERLMHQDVDTGSVTSWKEKVQTVYDDGKKYLILPTRVAMEAGRWKYLPQTRIEEVPHESSFKFIIKCEIESNTWPRQTSETTYATYLVYKQRNNEVQPRPAQVKDKNSSRETYDIYLHTPQTPVIIGGKVDRKIHNPTHRPTIKGLPKQRRDGWMEVQIWEFQIDTTTEMHLKLSSYDASLKGIVPQGIEFRPTGKY